MRYFAAPMEGITSYIWRNAHHKYYPGIDKYYTPFLTPKKGKGWTAREKSEIFPDHNQDIVLVPQILTKDAEDFVRMADRLAELGYREVNLNLGCPSGTVVSKGKGSGLLKEPEILKRFLDQIFSLGRELPVRVSVKTRLGIACEEEILTLMDIFNQFPIYEIIIHARVQKDMYKLPARREAFRKALTISCHPVCYNGDIFTRDSAELFTDDFPEVNQVMLGRGLIANPQLAAMIRQDQEKDTVRLKQFLEEVCLGYEEIMSGDRNVLFKMKELWSYILPEFPETARRGRKIRKSGSLKEYRQSVDEWFSSIPD